MTSPLLDLPIETPFDVAESFVACDEPISGDTKLRKVLHVVSGENYAGAERVQDRLALRLPEQGFQVGFACLKLDRFAALRQAKEVPLHDIRMHGRMDLRVLRPLVKLIRQEGYELVHAHTPRSALVGRLAAVLAGVPMVYHAHSQTTTEIHAPWLTRANVIMERASLFGAAGIIAVSETSEFHLRRNGYRRHRIWLVPNGVPGCGPLPAWRAERTDWTIGVLALFRRRKGLEVLLRALTRLREANLHVRLRAVGRFETPEYEQEVLALAAEMGLTDTIDWVGFRQDVTAELRQVDMMVLPSVASEGMPMSVLEAMAAGAIVIGTRVDGLTDLIHSGVDGLLVNPGDDEDLAGAIEGVIRGQIDAEQLRKTAWRRHAERFSDSSMAAGVAGVYREVLSV